MLFFTPKIPKKQDIKDIIVIYIEYCKYKNLSVKTIKSYYQTLMLFSQYLEEEKQITDISKMNKKIVEEYIQFTKNRGKYCFTHNEEMEKKANLDERGDIGKEVSNSTLNNYLRNIKAFASFLNDNYFVNDIDECEFIKMERKAKEQLTDEEYKKLIKAMDITKFHKYRDFVIINLIFDTGMRLSETLHLTVNYVDLLRRLF